MYCVRVFTAGSKFCQVGAFLYAVVGALYSDDNMKEQKSTKVVKLATASLTS